MMAKRVAARGGKDTNCPVRCLFRLNVRHHLVKAGYQEVVESVFASSSQHDEEVLRQFPAIQAFRGVLVNMQEEKKNEFLQLVIALRAYQGGVDKSFELYLSIANRLWARPNFGRIASLMAFCGFAMSELGGNGPDFVKSMVNRVEDDVADRVNSFLVKSGKSAEIFSRDSKSDLSSWDWRDFSFNSIGLKGVAALASSAVLIAAVLAK